MPSRSVLVTGASGFLGSRLVKQLVARGHHVKALVRPGARLRALTGIPADRMKLVYGDVMIASTVYQALASCDRMFHVAANFSMWSTRPATILEPAVQGTRAVLEAASRRGLERIVVTSSCAVLGASETPTVLDETHRFNLKMPEIYIEAKRRAKEVVDKAVADGAPIVTVMPSVLFGPGDWKPTPNGRALLAYLTNSPDFRVPVVSGGINVADVDDVALGHILAMDLGRLGEEYILGGQDVTFVELVKMLAEMTGLAQPGPILGRRVMSVVGAVAEAFARFTDQSPLVTRRMADCRVGRYLYVNSGKAERELGYMRRSLRETMDRSIRWYLKNRYLSEQQVRRIWLELRAN